MFGEADLAFVARELNFWRLQSSNARTSPPGVLEWQEGERILAWAAARLGLSEAERDRAMLNFLRRCWHWLAEHAARTDSAKTTP